MFRKHERRQLDFVTAMAGDTERGALLRQIEGLRPLGFPPFPS